jgi:hypothetical protein
MPYHATASKPGSVSAIVGTSGKAGRRLGEATASNLSLALLRLTEEEAGPMIANGCKRTD